jgi:hypothetical protein
LRGLQGGRANGSLESVLKSLAASGCRGLRLLAACLKLNGFAGLVGLIVENNNNTTGRL